MLQTARRSLEEVDEIFLNEKFGITHTRKPAPKRARMSFSAPAQNNGSDELFEKAAGARHESVNA